MLVLKPTVNDELKQKKNIMTAKNQPRKKKI